MNHTTVGKFLLTIIASVSVGCTGCDKLDGTYVNANGAITLALKSGGVAELTMMGSAERCAYKVDGKKLILTCRGDSQNFVIQDDGSISGPMVGTMKKAK